MLPIIHDEPARHQSYALRCWAVRRQDPDRPATWRFSLEGAPTSEKRAFADLEALVAFLQTELGKQENDSKGDPQCASNTSSSQRPC